MRMILSFILLLVWSTASCTRLTHTPSGKSNSDLQLRVMTYNIHHAAGQDGKVDVARIARVILEQNPDLVALQEVDVHTTRSGRIDEPAELARLTGMHVVFGKAIDFSDGEFGQAILSKSPIAQSTVHQLPGEAKKEQRIALATQITLTNGATLQFVSTHLDHTGGTNDRASQVNKLIELFARDDSTTLLAGDFNAIPQSPAMQTILHHFSDTAATDLTPTFPSDAPSRKIDWILVRPAKHWRIIKSWVVPESIASDHRPLVADVELVGK